MKYLPYYLFLYNIRNTINEITKMLEIMFANFIEKLSIKIP